MMYQEQQSRLAHESTIDRVVQRANVQTVDKKAFSDALRCMYFLNKHEMAHTTNFRHLCVLLGNTRMARLKHGANVNYESEMTMQEMVRAIGACLEEDILQQAKQSPYYATVFDKAMDISVHKPLSICIQYLGTLKVHNLQLLEMLQHTDTLVHYITSSGLDLSHLAGGSSDGAAVMVGSKGGVMTRLKALVPLFISTRHLGTRT